MFKSAGNPQALLKTMIKNNPQIQQVQDLINNEGGDAEAAFYKLAEKQGIDPNEVLSLFR